MQEIATFKIDKNMCSNCREDENCPQKYSVNGNCIYIEKDLVKEQVPETWEELKEALKEIYGKDERYTFKVNETNRDIYIDIDNEKLKASLTLTKNNHGLCDSE